MRSLKKLPAIRKYFIEQRNTLPIESRRNKDQLIFDTLTHMHIVLSCESSLTYVNFRSEVATLPLLNFFLELGKVVCVPRALPTTHTLETIRIHSLPNDLVPGFQGIQEPRPELCINGKYFGAIDIIIVPGLAFTDQGGRIGYGGGYYDRYLADTPQSLRIGLAYELQIASFLPLDSHDQFMDYIVTEKRIITCQRSRR